MIIYAYLGIKDSISTYVIIIFSIYLSFYDKIIIISKYINLGLIMRNSR